MVVDGGLQDAAAQRLSGMPSYTPTCQLSKRVEIKATQSGQRQCPNGTEAERLLMAK